MSPHVFTRDGKVTFFRGTSLRTLPLGGTARSQDSSWVDLRDGEELDEAQPGKWVRQGAG